MALVGVEEDPAARERDRELEGMLDGDERIF